MGLDAGLVIKKGAHFDMGVQLNEKNQHIFYAVTLVAI